MRYIHEIYTADLGRVWENDRLLVEYEPEIEKLPLGEEARAELLDFIRFQLVGERARRSVLDDWTKMESFATRAETFERGANEAVDRLAEQVLPAAEKAGITFDAVLSTTATGSLMPGLSYRMARRLGGIVPEDSMLLDLAHVGCTGSTKALNLAQSLNGGFKNILVLAVEMPSTLVDTTGTDYDLWQGNCTFGDGAAAVWVSSDVEQGPGALAMEKISYKQQSSTGLDLIRWTYRDYYSFALANHKTFEADVRQHVVDALKEVEAGWKDEPRWAIHPAGITLLIRISRKLGIPGDALAPSIAHYRRYSNMSSASVIHILRDVSDETPAGSAVNLLTMGAGFNVIYGRVRRVR